MIHTLKDFRQWSDETLKDRLLFFGPDPHHAIGLDQLVQGLAILCVDDAPALSDLERGGVDILALQRIYSDDPLSRSSRAILENPRAIDWISRPDPGTEDAVKARPSLTFKSSFAVENACKALTLNLLAAKSGLSRRWENKTAIGDLTSDLGISGIPSAVIEPATTSFEELRQILGGDLVLQSPHGYSGAKTLRVRSAEEFDSALETLRSRRLRASSFLSGPTLTLNACVTAKGTAVGRPFLQLTGLPSLTPHRLGSCGNDWVAGEAYSEAFPSCKSIAERIGGALARAGFMGVFGLDLLVDSTSEVRLIEVNPRLVASISMYTQLELSAGRVPLLARHLMAFLAPELDDVSLDEHWGPLSGGQLIVHDLTGEDRIVSKGMRSGQYELGRNRNELKMSSPCVHLAESLHLDEPLHYKDSEKLEGSHREQGSDCQAGSARQESDVDSRDLVDPYITASTVSEPRDIGDSGKGDVSEQGRAVILAPGAGRRVSAGKEWARIQSQQSILTTDGTLEPSVGRMLQALGDAVILSRTG